MTKLIEFVTQRPAYELFAVGPTLGLILAVATLIVAAFFAY